MSIRLKASLPVLAWGVLFELGMPGGGISAPPGGPRILFSDLESGPNRGGENNAGAFVTIYGKGFGSSRRDSTISVGGGLVAAYPTWSDTKIAFQLGPRAATGNIVVTVNGMESNGLPFTVRPGRIFFVAAKGSDSGDSIRKCKNRLGAGDICYVGDGVAQTSNDVYNAALPVFAEAGGSGRPGYPKALVAYPGARAQIGSDVETNSGLRFLDIHGPVAYWVVAGFHLRGKIMAVGIGGRRTTHIRIVGNEIQCPNGNGATACLETSQASHLEILGNEVTNAGVAGASKLYHSMYFSTDTNHVEVGWNHIHDNHSCRGIQFHSSRLGPDAGYNQYDLNVHGNIIHGQVCDGINLATVDPSKGAVRLYNNVIYQTGRGPDPPDGGAAYTCIYVSGATNNGAPGTGDVEVYNNTLYDCGSRGGSSAGAFGRASASPELRLRLENNLVYQKPGEAYFAGWTAKALVSGRNNLWYGAGAGPAWLAGGVNADPHVADAGTFDFHLRSGSPAIDRGVPAAAAADIDGVARPQGKAYDIGAFEFP